MKTTYISIQPDHLDKLKEIAKEYDVKIIHIDDAEDGLHLILIEVPKLPGNLYLLGMRMGAISLHESFSKI